MDRVLDFYRRPSPLTAASRHPTAFDELPADVRVLVRAIQQLVIYDVVAPAFYGFTIPPARQHEIHLRSIDDKLDRVFALDERSLVHPRPVDKRLAGRCHHFVTLLVAMLRSKGIAARARCGFGAYFNPPWFEDHWIAEVWNADEKRWTPVDVQFDEVWRAKLKIDHDVFDVPRDRFLVAGDAWSRCRSGDADPARFGIEFAKLRGLWYVAGNLVRDLAALNKSELLPWDVWGAQPKPDETLGADRLAFHDRIAEATRSPDPNFDALRALYDGDASLRVPPTVFNALRNRAESISPRRPPAARAGGR